MNRRWHMVNALIIIIMIVMPSIALASVPTTTSFDRENFYQMDGYRDGGYYAVRKNPATWGFMNMSHEGGTREFNITTNNIGNITLDFDLMFERRSFLFGWENVSWEDMVASLGDEIVINIDSVDGIDELRFVDHPQVRVQVLRDGLVYQPYGTLAEVEIEVDPLESGSTQVILQFDRIDSMYNLFLSIVFLSILIGISLIVIRYFQRILFYDGTYYKKWGGEF